MLVLVGVGFLAGLVTALSPCVLPVLPIVLAGGATGRRPLRIIVGLVASFTVFTLGAAWLLDLFGLPQDLLRNLAIGLLFVVAAAQLFPQVGDVLAWPLTRLARRPAGDLGGGFLLGASLGLVFVPCAGPVLAAVTVLSATHRVGFEAILLTLCYSAGLALPLLAIAAAGRGAAARLRSHAVWVRRVSGITIAAAAVAIAVGADRHLQTLVPGYTNYFQTHVEASKTASDELQKLTGAHPVTDRPSLTAGAEAAGTLPDYGTAPNFARITAWLNSKPLTMQALRGKVVLLDFWTYSCINCLRTLPHLKSWAATYGPAGLVIVGVHTPEFAFEHVIANVRNNTDRLGVHYPVAIDNDYGTWNAWGNQYWPAEFLIDRQGHVRHSHFGEGSYDETESSIRQLLAEGSRSLPAATQIADPTPSGTLTQESYLGFARLARYGGSALVPGKPHTYTLPAKLAADNLAYGGRWTVNDERIVAGNGARIQLRYTARAVYIVLAGTGTMTVRPHGQPPHTVRIDGDRLYTATQKATITSSELELRFSPGIKAYSFTFG